MIRRLPSYTAKTKRILAVLAVLGCFIAGPPGPELVQANDRNSLKARFLPGIKGEDNRKTVNAAQFPWSAVGRVNRSVGGFCTGTLIGVHVVLTAAHCLHNPKTQKWLPPDSVHFLAGYQRGDYLKHARAKRLIIPKGFRYSKRPKSQDAAHDWALLVLDAPLGAHVGYLGVEAFPHRGTKIALETSANGMLQAGFSQDRPHILSAHIGCRMTEYLSAVNLVLHDCDAVNGDSGSPLLMQHNGDYYIRGIHVGTHRHRDPALGIAVPTETFFNSIREILGRPQTEQQFGTLITRGHPPPKGQ